MRKINQQKGMRKVIMNKAETMRRHESKHSSKYFRKMMADTVDEHDSDHSAHVTD